MECNSLLVGCSLLLVGFAIGAVPPDMLTRDFSIQYVKPGFKASERCMAVGDPKPTYIWKKDGIVLSTDAQYEINSNTGDINIKGVTVVNGEGTYQCYAQNSQGIAVSGFWEVRVATLTGFETVKTNNVLLNEYAYYRLPCENQPSSTPAPKLDWVIGTNTETVFPNSTEAKRRVIIDADGTLHFLFVRASDNANNPYRCQLFNDFISIKAISSESFNLNVLTGYTTIIETVIEIVIEIGPEVTSKPILRYSKSVEETIGSQTTLMCIFSGNPIPEVEWFKDGVRLPDGSSLPDGTPRYKIDPEDSTGRKLIISKLEITDEGKYICRARNILGVNESTVAVKVKGPPQWKKETLKSTRIPVGRTAAFHCDTVSYNARNSVPMWMKNGNPLIGCGVKKFWCGSGTDCYDYQMKCDNTSNCPGSPSTDELNCLGQDGCSEGMFSCGGGQCQTAATVITCDGIPQCPNGGDESVRHCGCSSFSDFMCADLQKCIPASEICNKIANCKDGSDERNCAYHPEKIIDNKFHFSADLKQLTIPNVKKIDTMCIQCLVYNFREYGPNPKPDIVGITFGDACLTVLDPINILSGLPEKQKVQPGDIINFTIAAQTDPLEQGNLQYDWYIGGKKYPDQFSLGNWSQIIKLSMGNRHIVIDTSTLSRHDDRLFQQLMGNMSVRVYHEFDQRTISTELFTDVTISSKTVPGIYRSSSESVAECIIVVLIVLLLRI